MTILLSKDYSKSLVLCQPHCFTLADGGMLILLPSIGMKSAKKWLYKNGVSGIKFSKTGDILPYRRRIIIYHEQEAVALRLFNDGVTK